MFKATRRLLVVFVLALCFRPVLAAAPSDPTAGLGSVLVQSTAAEQSDADPTSTALSDESATAGEGTASEPSAGTATHVSSPRCTACPCRCGCASDQPWTLPQPCVLESLGVKVGGWLQQGITLNAQDPPVPFNGPVATNDLDSEYQMNQLWFFLDRPVKRGEGLSIGGHMDMLYGSDWRFGINYGLEDQINGFDRQTYGIVIPQLYMEVAYGNLSVKMGHFAAILDYEMVPAPPNPFYSHSYSYGYTVPQLVMGLLGDYMLTDQFSVQAGFHRGWMMWEDNNDHLDFMGGLKWNSADKQTSLAYAISTGPQDPLALQERFVYSLVAQHQLTENLRAVLVHNLGIENQALPGGEDAEWYGLNSYLLYKLNACWSANVRAEWLRDDDGVRIAGPGNIPGVRAFDGRGFAGNFYETTLGLKGQLTPNLVMRPEVRWDWYDGPAGPTGLPFDGGNGDEQFLVGTDLIFTY